MLPGEDAGRALPFRSSPTVGLGQEGGDMEKGPQDPQEWSEGRREHCGCEAGVVAGDAQLPSADPSEGLAGWEVTCGAGGRMGS